MQQKLCLWLCVAVLLGALCAGNPFLGGRDGATPLVTAPARAPARAPLPAAATPVRDALRSSLDGGARKALGTHASAAPRGGERAQPVNAVVPVALAASVPADAAARCPDAALAPLVQSVELDARGEPAVWVLRDGRRLVRNPRNGDGEPLLVTQ
jgi:hypothetical protein